MKNRIKKIREAKNLTQAELADRLKISLGRVKNLETDRVRDLTASEIKQFIYLGINPVWFLTGMGDMFTQPDCLNKHLADVYDWINSMSEQEQIWLRVDLEHKYPLFKEWLEKK